MENITGDDHGATQGNAPAAASPGTGFIEPSAQGATGPADMRLRDWTREGLRAALFFRPRVTSPEPAALHLLAIVLAIAALHLGMERLAVPGPASFDLRGWLTPWWTMAASVLVVWCLFSWARDAGGTSRPGTAAWFALVLLATLPLALVSTALAFAWSRGWTTSLLEDSPALTWGLYVLLWAWDCALGVRIALVLGLRARALAVLAVALLALNVVTSWQFQDRAWYPARKEADADPQTHLVLSQESFESQQALRDKALSALLPQRPGVVDVYGIVFAPYAPEDVFLRESTMVGSVLRDRFDGQGRLVQLVNHATTTATLPWATPANLQRAITAVAAKMDPAEDVLVVYLTSHGASNFQLAASHWPLEVPALTPTMLRDALDEAGVRHRVIAVSACYSGGWVDTLASDDTLVMTAADATHTSYGCGRKSPLTFFGRAVFDEQLRRTHSFEDAFAAAVPVIRQREVEGKKPDGFSNPQIRVGVRIRPVLAGLAKRLDGQP
ncbi:MAG: hypothetical protein NVS2B4_12890 [Ramlibacter sp.]